VAQDGTVPVPDSDDPIVTNAMIAAGISQLPSAYWTLAEITKTLRLVYRMMWRARGDLNTMMAHELLRQATQILAAGHSRGANARDDAGRIVDLHVGVARASINPAAVAFSPYGAICKAASLNHGTRISAAMWSVLADLARERVGGTVHPLHDINYLEDVTTSELVALHNEAADMIDPANTEPRTAAGSLD
jgi:hypothetical protein